MNADAVVTTKVSYGFEVRSQSAREPHQLNIALAFALKTPARLNPVQIAIDIDLQQLARMIGRATCSRLLCFIEAQLCKVKLLYKRLDNPDRVVLCDEVIKAFWK
ncbi:hypothetical protein PAMC26577_15960 [Caballeronia sordidicola]|uniref:Uncharacterized protein n=1 Tax=Caballeronia sordidicola TaxID=196367 RepID=A0A242MSG9_CABSO|nr:hypothetical protein PAMC26577_15960 [Caballeronia sordidicola]